MRILTMRLSKAKNCETPTNLVEITDWIDAHPEAERENLYKCMRMTWNFVAEINNALTNFGGDSVEHLDKHISGVDVINEIGIE